VNTIKYKGFKASLEFDLEDKIIVGRVLDISDIISFHAPSIPEFEEVFQQSIDSYIRDCEALNRTPEKPASGKLILS
jgi:predicted HicB family RNase H-like nuclease